VFDKLTGTSSFLVVIDSRCCDEQCSVDLTQEVAGRRRHAEVYTDTVGPHQTPMFTLLRRVVDRSVRHVLTERMRSTGEFLECKRTACIVMTSKLNCTVNLATAQ